MHSLLSGRPGRFLAITLALCVGSALAETPLPQVERLKTSPVLRQLKPNPLPHAPSSPGEETLAQMYVPEGFAVDLVAAEPDVRQPVAFAFDERGRIWIAEAHSYPTRRPAGEGLDRLIILEDRDGDGRFESRKVFAEGLNLVSGFELGFGGVWVGAAPELLFIADRDHDDVPDGPPQVLLEGFGYQDTHECLNSFHWGPDGWLYGIQGVFNYARIGRPGAAAGDRQELRAGVWRYHPIRHEFEIFAHGGSNPWGLDHDEHGQLFMTHCRSYWGRGGTTHVLQGGQFWNQANANYAPFIVADPPADFPGFRNYLLASARYDHGAGGAGERGSDAIYGGHSHVGTMIYLGDNWPDAFRGHLFTHNLHGHQINQQVNRRWGSGFDTVHAGYDHLFCTDPKYVAIDLQYGPDGAVYIIDWYDQQHCHNPNAERWERGNGRVYRMAYRATYHPVLVNLAARSDRELVQNLSHRNEWYVRTSRRLLQERAHQRPIEESAVAAIGELFTRAPDAVLRLRALWTAHAIGRFSDEVAQRGFADSDEYVRAWCVQLSAEGRSISEARAQTFLRLAESDASAMVRLYLASALQRLPDDLAWRLAEALARHGEDREDRNLPRLLWHGLATRVPKQLDRALSLAASTPWPQLADWILWYAATLGEDAVDRAIATFRAADEETLRRRLAGLWLALEPRANLPMPGAWRLLAPNVLTNSDVRIRRRAEQIAAAFGDTSILPALRATLADTRAERGARRHAFGVLRRAHDAASLPALLPLLDDSAFRMDTLGLLASYDDPAAPKAIVQHFETFSPEERGAALNTLTRRVSFATALLDALADGQLKRDHITAFHIRQLSELKNPAIDQRVAATWGRIQATPAEKRQLIDQLVKIFDEAPLWAYDAGAGREHFLKLCSSCHVLGRDGNRIGPELTGAGRNGINYFLENIIDPNAVVGSDFQMTTIDLRNGDVVSGLKLSETATALTLRTTTEQQVIAKSDIIDQSHSQLSLMPEGLLEPMAPRERLELLKYLIEN